MYGNENSFDASRSELGSASVVNFLDKKKMFRMSKSSSSDFVSSGYLKEANLKSPDTTSTPKNNEQPKLKPQSIIRITNNNLNRSNSVELNTKQQDKVARANLNKTADNLKPASKSKSSKELSKSTSSFEPPSSLVEMHKFLKDQKIYSNPNDNFKRRTIVLVRPRLVDNKPGEFGFHLQTYGLLNSTTKQTEFICFVNNIQPNSPAKLAGLSNGDVLLAIDGNKIDEFRSMEEITKHVRNKNELRLVVMCENVCKKIQLQQRAEKIRKMLRERRSELEKVDAEERRVLSKYKELSSPMPNSAAILNSTPIQTLNSDANNESFILSPSSKNASMMKITESQLSSSSSSSSSSTSLNQAKSIAHKYLKQTSRIVRSASSSSMNILSNLKIKSESPSRLNVNNAMSESTSRHKVVTVINPDDKESMASSSFSASSSTRSSSSFNSNQTVKPSTAKSNNATEAAYFQPISSSSVSSSYSSSNAAAINRKALFNKLNHSDNLDNTGRFTVLSNKPKIRSSDKETNIDPGFAKVKIVDYVSLSSSFSPILSTSSISSSSSSSASSSPDTANNNNNNKNKAVNGVDSGIGLASHDPSNAHTIAKVISNGGGFSLSNYLSYAGESSFAQVPVMDYSNEDYVITRL